jgi:hypothetical protein
MLPCLQEAAKVWFSTWHTDSGSWRGPPECWAEVGAGLLLGLHGWPAGWVGSSTSILSPCGLCYCYGEVASLLMT